MGKLRQATGSAAYPATGRFTRTLPVGVVIGRLTMIWSFNVRYSIFIAFPARSGRHKFNVFQKVVSFHFPKAAAIFTRRDEPGEVSNRRAGIWYLTAAAERAKRSLTMT